MTDDQVFTKPPPPRNSSRLAAQNTSLAFQNTRMAADRTLMAVIRTALSLISFGFTIFKVAQNLVAENVLKVGASAVPHFGVGLVLLGIMVLGIGIIYHLQFMRVLRLDRKQMAEDGLIRGKSPFPPSFTLLTAFILFAFGLAVIISMLYHAGPFE